MFSGRQNRETGHAETFKRSPIIDFNCSRERRHLDAIDHAVWSAGQWAITSQSQTEPVFAWGYWTAIYAREGDAWKFRMLTLSEHLPPAAAASPTASPSNQ
jgi:hypothetical protein